MSRAAARPSDRRRVPTGPPSDARHHASASVSPETLAEIRAVAGRLDRSVSWVIQRAWRVSRDRIRATPSVSEDGAVVPAPRAANVPGHRVTARCDSRSSRGSR